jgi:hypothetical protein
MPVAAVQSERIISVSSNHSFLQAHSQQILPNENDGLIHHLHIARIIF